MLKKILHLFKCVKAYTIMCHSFFSSDAYYRTKKVILTSAICFKKNKFRIRPLSRGIIHENFVY